VLLTFLGGEVGSKGFILVLPFPKAPACWGIEVKFCPKCGSLLTPERRKGRVYLVCKRCGYSREMEKEERGYRIRETVSEEKREKLIVIEGLKKREKEKLEEERELLREYYEVFLETMESEGE